MKLKRLYSNHPDLFEPIRFNDGLSVVLAEIRLPANRLLDTHNLGKTTVGELIDFCLLKRKSSSFFLFKHEARFEAFTFYIEVTLDSGGYLTIARPVIPGSQVDMVKTEDSLENVLDAEDLTWDHTGLPFDRAKLLLDGLLGMTALQPWGFRKLVGYLVRSQRDYLDVFQLGKFSGKHKDWKPFVAHLLGLEAESVSDLYEKRDELETATAHLNSLTREWGGEDVDPSVLDGLISVKRRDVDAKAAVLESFNFNEEDGRVTADLVDQVEAQIAYLNEESYRLQQLAKRIDDSLKEGQVLFKTSDAEALFRQAGVAFGEQIKRDYDQLLAFNRSITRERREALQLQATQTQSRLRAIREELAAANTARAQSLDFLRESDALEKFKELSREVSELRGELSLLESKRAAAARLIALRREQRTLAEEYGHLETEVETEISAVSQDEESRFGRLRRYFTEIVYEVLGQNALLAIRMNGSGGLDFTAEFIGESGIATSGDRGTSYKKLLCIAFDLAMLRAYSDTAFPRFVYHDGAFEQLEPRKREKLLGIFRLYADMGLQPIVSLLDSDMNEPLDSGPDALSSAEVVLRLHDEGAEGRLFKMPTW